MITPDKFDEPGVTPTPLAPPPPSHRGWKLSAVFLAMTTVVCGIGWIETAHRASTTSLELHFRRSDLANAQRERDSVEGEMTNLRLRFSKALAVAPVVVTKIDLTNTGLDNHDLGSGPTEEFDADSIRYITFHVSGPNQCFGVRDFKGQIDVKFISPDGGIIRGPDSPSDFSLSVPLQIPTNEEAWEVQSGWGSNAGGGFVKGVWHIQFFCEGRLIGDKSFTVR